MKKFKFIDLFAGIGGFHQAASNLGGKCVFASEIDKYCIETYKENYNIDPDVDIRKIDASEIPKFDLLLAGFPCQTFSKAGNQEGFLDKTRGTLFFDIIRIIEYHKPKYVLLENVRNLVSHDNGNTWKIMLNSFKTLGYSIPDKPLILSPHHFGIPHLRERVFIPAIYDPNKNIDFNIKFKNLKEKKDNNIEDILEKNIDSSYNISELESNVLDMWEEFKQNIVYKSLGFPVWVDVFTGVEKTSDNTPNWKRNIINKNKELYKNNKDFIDYWIDKYNVADLPKGLKKFEWQAGKDHKSIFECLVQFRPSGVRVKRPDVSPALVAMVQVPVYAKEKRYLSVRECGNLQSFDKNFNFNKNVNQSYKQLGNAVNVTVAQNVLKKLLQY